MHSITISLDGFEEAHDWMRRIPNGFKHAVEAIKLLVDDGDIRYDVVTCTNQKNYATLSEFKDFLISLGVKEWRIFTVFPVGRAASDPELQLSAEQYTQLMDFIVKTREEGRIKLEYACEGFLGRYEGKVRDHLYTCQAGLSIASVRIDGGISGCNSVRAHFDQGNIYKDDFVDVWENRFQPFRDRSWAKKGKCSDCSFWRYCQGNGMHLRADDGSLIMCNLERII